MVYELHLAIFEEHLSYWKIEREMPILMVREWISAVSQGATKKEQVCGLSNNKALQIILNHWLVSQNGLFLYL